MRDGATIWSVVARPDSTSSAVTPVLRPTTAVRSPLVSQSTSKTRAPTEPKNVARAIHVVVRPTASAGLAIAMVVKSSLWRENLGENSPGAEPLCLSGQDRAHGTAVTTAIVNLISQRPRGSDHVIVRRQ